MDEYWVNNHTDANPNNDHEVHKKGCSIMPYYKTRLGHHNDCDGVLQKARANYSRVDGSIRCIPEYHDR